MGEVFDYENPNNSEAIKHDKELDRVFRERDERLKRNTIKYENVNIENVRGIPSKDAVVDLKNDDLTEKAQRLKNSSCGIHVTQKSTKRKRKVNPFEKAKRIVAGIGITTLLASSAYGTSIVINNIAEKINYAKDAETAIAIAEANMIDKLTDAGLAAYTKDDEFVILQNDDKDYLKLELDTPEEIWTAREVINDDKEFEKVIQCSTYNNGEYMYLSLSQFLGINGYFDTKTGETSIEVWENMVENNLVQYYRNGELTLNSSEEVLYTDYYEGNEYTGGRSR